MSIRGKELTWEKWYDPYGDDVDEIIETNFEGQGKAEAGDPWDDNEDEPDLGGNEQFGLHRKPMKMIATGASMIPLVEHTIPSKIFDFWTGHTNFDITEGVLKQIESTPGVETLTIFTRYRFRVGIGKAFDRNDIMHNIMTNIQAEPPRGTKNTG